MPEMRRIAPVLLLAGFASVARGSVLPQNLEHLESAAERIFVGVCIQRTGAVGERGLAVTEYTFQVTEAVKGQLKKGGRVLFRQVGREEPNAKGVALRVAGLPSYKVGQEVLVFLNRPSRIGLTAPVGLAHGVFHVERDPNGGQEIRIGAVRRKTLVAGIAVAKYAANERFTATQRQWLGELPERVNMQEFCALIRRMGEARERAANQAGGEVGQREGREATEERNR